MEFASDESGDVVCRDEPAACFELECRLPSGRDIVLTPRDFPGAERSADPGISRTRYHAEGREWAGSLRVETRWERQDRETRASIEIQNDSALLVRRVRFPAWVRRPVYPRDRLLFPTPWGDDIEGPLRCLRASGDRGIEYLYPSQLAMQYMVLYNSGRSSYLSAYSLRDDTFALAARARGGDDAVELSCVWHPFLHRGTWSSPETGFAVLPGDRHAAADLYRQRMQERFPPAERPAWMQEEFHGWVQVGMKTEDRPPRYRYADLPALFDAIRTRTGLSVMHVFGWSGRGHDTLYPDYDVNPELGGERDLRGAMDAIRAKGGRAVLYTNARLIDPESRFARISGGDAACCRTEDGGVYEEFYGTSAKTRVACPGSAVYRDYLIGQIEKIITRYGAHAVQLDQVSCNPGFLCFSTAHDHDAPATNFLAGYDRLLRDLRARHRALDPDFFTWAEGVHERFGRHYDVNQGHGEDFTWQIGRSVPEQFAYTYPGFLVTGMCLSRWHLCWAHGQGKPFDFYVDRIGDDAFCGLVRAFIGVRKRWKQYFSGGVFRDSVGLDPLTPGLRAWRIDRRDGQGSLVNLWLPGNENGGGVCALARDLAPDARIVPVYPGDLAVSRDRGLITASWDGPFATIVWED